MSEYREIPEEKILIFPPTSGFKHHGIKKFFSEDSVTHPAKANLALLKWIILHYTKEGDLILDPMAGTGSTGIIASLYNRNSILVEYEETFCKMIQDNINLVKKHTGFETRGEIICIQGDARGLSRLLKELDVIITSPPYSETKKHDERAASPEAIDLRAKKFEEGSGEDYHTPGRLGTIARHFSGYSTDPDNIGNLPHGDIEVIITSPPYGSDNANLKERKDKSAQSILSTTGVRAVPLEEDNIGVLEYGDVDNIEKLTSESYLEAMLQVYRECHKVLKPNGTLVLITKNFIRDKAVVRLDEDTIKLCDASGFQLIEHWYFKLPTKSFWRILYHRRFPDVSEIIYEDVMVFKKVDKHESSFDLSISH